MWGWSPAVHVDRAKRHRREETDTGDDTGRGVGEQGKMTKRGEGRIPSLSTYWRRVAHFRALWDGFSGSCFCHRVIIGALTCDHCAFLSGRVCFTRSELRP